MSKVNFNISCTVRANEIEYFYLKCKACILTWNSGEVSHDLHDEQGEELVLLQHLLGGQRVTVVVEGEHDEAPVGADEQEAPDTKHVKPDSPKPGSNCTNSTSLLGHTILQSSSWTYCTMYIVYRAGNF